MCPIDVLLSSADLTCVFDMTVNRTVFEHDMQLDMQVVTQIHPSYSGEYEFTPNDNTQIVATAGQILEQDIVINPVPNTYGHVAWDGRFISIS